jgi:flavin-dependent dehydrogenase
VTFQRGSESFEIECERLVVADGVRSGLGKVLGRDGLPVILTAASNGPTDQLAVSRPAPVVLATRRR